MKTIFQIILILFLTACSGNPSKNLEDPTPVPERKVKPAPIYTPSRSKKTNYRVDDTTYNASGYSERVHFIVLHYTAANTEVSIRALTGPNVSSHYLITSSPGDPIFQLLPEEKRAWHAGISEFQGFKGLNDTSIGIEIVNPGYRKVDGELKFYQYSEQQIQKVVKLLKDIIIRYDIDPTRVVGHSDIAPDRKHDPGPFFPWERLYKEYGIGAWYDADAFRVYNDPEYYKLISTREVQRLFKRYGYPMKITGEWDEYNKKVVRAFQMHFRPSSYTGEMDLETFAILMALIRKYDK